MLSEFSINLFFSILAASVTAYLGLLVFIHNRQGFSNKIFMIHAAIGSIWSIVTYLSVLPANTYSIFFVRLVIFFAVPHVFLFLFFVQNFPSESKGKTKSFYSAIIIMAFMMIASLTPFVFGGGSIENGQFTPSPGVGMPIFALLLVIFFLWSTFLVFKKYFRSTALNKKQWLVIGSGFIAAYTLLIFFVFLRVITLNDTSYVPLSPLFILPIFIGVAFAILRHNLFNVRVITAEFFTFFLLVASVIEALIAKTVISQLIAFTIVILVLIFGILLVKSVHKEVKQRERLEEVTKALGQANTKLKKADEMKDQFLSFASHDLKSPIAKMKQWASLIYDKTYKEPKQVEDTAYKIKITGDRALRLVEEFLDLRKIEEGKMEFNPETKNVAAMVKEISNDFVPVAQQAGLTLTYFSQKEELNADIDEIKFRQVIENLIDNSIKYTDKGSIKVDVQEEQHSILIAISDTGGGMSKEVISGIFEQFHRAEGVKKTIKGTGLGLYIAKQIVESHHGQIWAESEGEGKGSTFKVRIPKK